MNEQNETFGAEEKEVAEKTAENGRIDCGGKESEVELFGI